MLKYTESHEWVKIDGHTAIIGITDYAQDQLGDVVYIELPTIGKSVKVGGEVAVLESTKAAADLYSPLSGEVIEVNQNLIDHVELINNSPENEGWICKLKIVDSSELDVLMDADEYQKMILTKR